MQLSRQETLRIAQFNVENLFLLLDQALPPGWRDLPEDKWQKLSSSTTRNKPLAHLKAIAAAIQHLDADIWMLCEVGGMESLVNFNQLFLGDAFIPHLIEGNSDRGIDIAYLVRRELPFKYDLISHKNRSIDFLYPHERQSLDAGYPEKVAKPSHRFSRDVLELRLFSSDSLEPKLIFLHCHLKSPLDKDRIDPFGRDRRKAELEKLVKIYLEINSEFSGRVPMIVGGDFNGLAQREMCNDEFTAIYRDTDLEDVLHLAQVPAIERFTHMQFQLNRPSYNRQIDYIFVSRHLHSAVVAAETGVYRFRDEYGLSLLPPRTLEEKRLLPSDHYPVITAFPLPLIGA